MELYAKTSYELSQILTVRYSSSFSSSTKLFSPRIKPHIFAIYGLVRIADEVVDTYKGADAANMLETLQRDTYKALKTGYSTNPIIHAFALTAHQHGIGADLIDPFFDSMRTDLTQKTFTREEYELYIYGSAEVIGLMCLKVFVRANLKEYALLKKGAKALGAAYQKVNFLRDIRSDIDERGRMYFPGMQYESFSESDKQVIIDDIERDFATAKPSLEQLPKEAQKAVKLSYAYYSQLLNLLKNTPVETLKNRRMSLPKATKLRILMSAKTGRKVRS